MLTFKEMAAMLDEIAQELPEELYTSLNGGVNLLRRTVRHPESLSKDLFILGEYHHGGGLGRFINIYYGSFKRVYGGLPPEAQREKLGGVLKHEFLHHLESMAGSQDLNIKDAIALEKYKRENASEPPQEPL